MEFTFETQYNAKTMASMAKALRKTIRKNIAAVLIYSGGLPLFSAYCLPYQRDLRWISAQLAH